MTSPDPDLLNVTSANITSVECQLLLDYNPDNVSWIDLCDTDRTTTPQPIVVVQTKTYQMPGMLDQNTRFYAPYDPKIGLRTAAVLTSFLFSIIIYTLYKTKCRRNRWSSDDKLFIDRYSKVLTDKWTGKSTIRRAYGTRPSIRNTAQWIQSQPLAENLDEVCKKGINDTMYKVCFESLRTTAFPVQNMMSNVNNITSVPNNNATTDSVHVTIDPQENVYKSDAMEGSLHNIPNSLPHSRCSPNNLSVDNSVSNPQAFRKCKSMDDKENILCNKCSNPELHGSQSTVHKSGLKTTNIRKNTLLNVQNITLDPKQISSTSAFNVYDARDRCSNKELESNNTNQHTESNHVNLQIESNKLNQQLKESDS